MTMQRYRCDRCGLEYVGPPALIYCSGRWCIGRMEKIGTPEDERRLQLERRALQHLIVRDS